MRTNRPTQLTQLTLTVDPPFRSPFSLCRSFFCLQPSPAMQLATSSLRSVQRSRMANVTLLRSISTSTAAFAAAPAPSSSRAPRRRSFLTRHPKKLAVGVLALGSGAAYLSTQSRSGAAASGSVAPPLPPFNLDDYRGLGSLAAFKTQQEIVLYQYETCPFCNKVRAFLDYSGIRYRTVEVNPLTKAEKNVSPALKACKEVPVLVVNGHILTDSTPIIKNLNDIMNLYRSDKEKHFISEDEMVRQMRAFPDRPCRVLSAALALNSFCAS